MYNNYTNITVYSVNNGVLIMSTNPIPSFFSDDFPNNQEMDIKEFPFDGEKKLCRDIKEQNPLSREEVLLTSILFGLGLDYMSLIDLYAFKGRLTIQKTKGGEYLLKLTRTNDWNGCVCDSILKRFTQLGFASSSDDGILLPRDVWKHPLVTAYHTRYIQVLERANKEGLYTKGFSQFIPCRLQGGVLGNFTKLREGDQRVKLRGERPRGARYTYDFLEGKLRIKLLKRVVKHTGDSDRERYFPDPQTKAKFTKAQSVSLFKPRAPFEWYGFRDNTCGFYAYWQEDIKARRIFDHNYGSPSDSRMLAFFRNQISTFSTHRKKYLVCAQSQQEAEKKIQAAVDNYGIFRSLAHLEEQAMKMDKKPRAEILAHISLSAMPIILNEGNKGIRNSLRMAELERYHQSQSAPESNKVGFPMILGIDYKETPFVKAESIRPHIPNIAEESREFFTAYNVSSARKFNLLLYLRRYMGLKVENSGLYELSRSPQKMSEFIRQKSKNGDTVFHRAAAAGYHAIFKRLTEYDDRDLSKPLEKTPIYQLRDAKGRTPFDIIREKKTKTPNDQQILEALAEDMLIHFLRVPKSEANAPSSNTPKDFDCITVFLSENGITNFTSHFAKHNRQIFHRLSTMDDGSLLRAIDFLCPNKNPESWLKTNNLGESIFHTLARVNDPTCNQLIIRLMNIYNLTPADVKKQNDPDILGRVYEFLTATDGIETISMILHGYDPYSGPSESRDLLISTIAQLRFFILIDKYKTEESALKTQSIKHQFNVKHLAREAISISRRQWSNQRMRVLLDKILPHVESGCSTNLDDLVHMTYFDISRADSYGNKKFNMSSGKIRDKLRKNHLLHSITKLNSVGKQLPPPIIEQFILVVLHMDCFSTTEEKKPIIDFITQYLHDENTTFSLHNHTHRALAYALREFGLRESNHDIVRLSYERVDFDRLYRGERDDYKISLLKSFTVGSNKINRLTLILDVLYPQKNSNILFSTNADGETIFHTLASEGLIEELENLLSITGLNPRSFQQMSQTNSVSLLLTEKNSDGKTFLDLLLESAIVYRTSASLMVVLADTLHCLFLHLIQARQHPHNTTEYLSTDYIAQSGLIDRLGVFSPSNTYEHCIHPFDQLISCIIKSNVESSPKVISKIANHYLDRKRSNSYDLMNILTIHAKELISSPLEMSGEAREMFQALCGIVAAERQRVSSIADTIHILLNTDRQPRLFEAPSVEREYIDRLTSRIAVALRKRDNTMVSIIYGEIMRINDRVLSKEPKPDLFRRFAAIIKPYVMISPLDQKQYTECIHLVEIIPSLTHLDRVGRKHLLDAYLSDKAAQTGQALMCAKAYTACQKKYHFMISVCEKEPRLLQSLCTSFPATGKASRYVTTHPGFFLLNPENNKLNRESIGLMVDSVCRASRGKQHGIIKNIVKSLDRDELDAIVTYASNPGTHDSESSSLSKVIRLFAAEATNQQGILDSGASAR